MNRYNGLDSGAETKQQLLSGLKFYIPVPDDLAKLNSPALIAGSDFHQMVQISLAPGEIISAQPGTMIMMSGGLNPNVDYGTCSGACTRCCCAGESFFRLNFHNQTQTSQFLALAPSKPGKIIPLPLETWQGVTLTAGAFFAAYGNNWNYKLKTVKNIGTGCFGGQGFFLTEMYGTGTIFISGSGAVEVLSLEQGEVIIVDQENLLAFSKGVEYDINFVGNCLTCCCGGMGMFNAVLKGPGTVIIESLPIRKFARALGFSSGTNNSNRGGGENGRGT